jgi:hypothetical protein
MPIGAFCKAASSSPRRIRLYFLVVIVTAAILLPVLLPSCGKSQESEENRSKSEDDFLDKDAKPDERKYLQAAKPFFIASPAENTRTLTRYSPVTRARMSLDQFKPAQQDSDVQQTNRMHSTT